MDDADRFEEHRRATELKKLGRLEDLRTLLLDLNRMRWLLSESGGIVNLDADLGLLEGDPAVDDVRVMLGAWASLLKPLIPAAALKATVISRLPAGEGRAALLASAREDKGIWLVPTWPLPDEEGPLEGSLRTGWPVTLLRSFPLDNRLLVGHGFEGRAASPPGGRDLWILSTDPLRRLATLPGHLGGVLTAEVSPTGREVLVADGHGGITLWTTEEGSLVPSLAERLASPHRYAVEAFAFSASGGEFATATPDGEVCLWNTKDREPIRMFLPAVEEEPSGHVLQLIVDPLNDCMIRSFNRSLEPALTDVWRLSDGVHIASHPGGIAVSSPTGLLRVEGDDVLDWNPTTGDVVKLAPAWLRPTRLTQRILNQVRGLAGTNTTEWVADWARTTDPDSWVRVITTERSRGSWVQSGSQIEIRAGMEHNARKVFIAGTLGASTQDRAGRWYAIGTNRSFQEGEVFVCHPAAGVPVRRLGGHAAPVSAAISVGDGQRLATGDRFGGLRVWSLTKGQNGEWSHAFSGTACATALDGSWFAICDSYRNVHIISREQARERFTVRHKETHFATVPRFTCLVSGDGAVVSAGGDGTVYVTDPRTGVLIWSFPGNDFQVVGAVATGGPSGWLWTVDEAQGIQGWDLERGTRLYRSGSAQTAILREASIVAGDSCDWIAVSGGRGRFLRPSDHWSSIPLSLGEEVTAVTSLMDDWLLVGDRAGDLSLRHSAQPSRVLDRWSFGDPIVKIVSTLRRPWVVCMSRASTGTRERWTSISLLDTSNGRLSQLVATKSSVWACKLSPNERLLAVVDGDGTATIWDLAERRAMTGIRVSGSLKDLSWSPDSKSICLAGSSGGYLFDLVPAGEVALEG